MTTTVLYYSPGQKASIFLETFGADNFTRANVTTIIDGYVDNDGYAIPIVTRVVFPDLSLGLNFPKPMTKLDTGLYFFQFTLPITASAIGSYLVDVSYIKPSTSERHTELYQFVVNAPFGNYSITT